MIRLLAFAALVAALAALTGCATKEYREYYEPTQETIVRRADGICHGALKSEGVREGWEWSDEKSFSIF